MSKNIETTQKVIKRNTRKVLKALDCEKSEFRYFSDGRIMGVENFIFIVERNSRYSRFS